MAAVPTNPSSTVQAIYRLHEARQAEQAPRPHLGASLIGRACERALWYGFHWAAPRAFSGRMLRLFDRGQLEEARFVSELRGIGCEVLETAPETGKQFQFVDVDGHFGGSMDGAACGLPEAPKAWHVLEFKTHNTKSFSELKTKGVREAKPEHWAQMQCYMGWSGMDRALYLAVCKDTDELYAERIEADPIAFVELVAKAQRIIHANQPPSRIHEDPSWWVCKFCDFHAICHGESAPAMNCRTCIHSTPISGGQWHCGRWQEAVPLDVQPQGCEEHRFIPPMITFADPVDVTDSGSVLYRHHADGMYWANGPHGDEIKDPSGELIPVYPSQELAGQPAVVVGDPTVGLIKTAFNAEAV